MRRYSLTLYPYSFTNDFRLEELKLSKIALGASICRQLTQPTTMPANSSTRMAQWFVFEGWMKISHFRHYSLNIRAGVLR